MGIRKNCVAVNKRSPSVMACGPLCAASSGPVGGVHRPRYADLWAISEGRREAGESTGAFAAPVRSQPPAVRAVSWTGADAFL